MDEYFLHYVWKFQKFKKHDLRLTNDHRLSIFHTGHHNHDSGPDFEEARIKIEQLEWVGHVEIHINSSDWNKHGHTSDKAYHNVILHVVWNHDTEIIIDNHTIPTLELKQLVDPFLIKKYRNHIQSPNEIACQNQLNESHLIHLHQMFDKVLVERLRQKAGFLLKQLTLSNNDWESITYEALASNFGFSTNKSAFQMLAHQLPYSIIKKNTHDPIKLEALIFGQSGFLNEAKDFYTEKLKHEYHYLASKFRLPNPMDQSNWKFGRMRPPNFPTIRLAQFASLLHYRPKLFSTLVEIEDPKEIITIISFELHSYWQTHYDFGKKRKRAQKRIGQSTFENLLINTVAPLLAAYSKHTDQPIFMDRAISLLEKIKSENNRITNSWKKLGVSSNSAFDSQAMIQLLKGYCHKKKCLQCSVGISILNR